MGVNQFDPDPYPDFQFLCEHGAWYLHHVAGSFLYELSVHPHPLQVPLWRQKMEGLVSTPGLQSPLPSLHYVKHALKVTAVNAG